MAESELVKISRMKPVIKPTKPHRHEGYHEIIFLTSGEGIHTIEIENYQLKTPAVFVLKPGQVHCWHFTKIPEGFVLMFHHDFYQKYVAGSGTNLTEKSYQKVNREDVSYFRKIMELAEVEYLSKKPDYHKALAYLIAILLTRLSNGTEFISTGKSTLKSRKFNQFISLVEKDFRHKRQVNYYASCLSITPKYLNEICQLCDQHTASQIIFSKIDEEAKRLLVHSGQTMSEIAMDLGFNDTSHFTRFFTKINRCTPKQFRNLRFE